MTNRKHNDRPGSTVFRRRMFFEPLEERRVLASISLGSGGGVAGGLDVPLFSGDGKTSIDAGAVEIGWDVAVQNDGKIVVVGSTDSAGSLDFVVARFNADGSIDTTFGGGDGVFIHDFEGGTDEARSVAIDAVTGNIVVGGSAASDASSSNLDFAVLRLTSAGVLDATFNSTGSEPGTVRTNLGGEVPSFEQGRGLALLEDGKIVLVGHAMSSSALGLVRYSEDGSLDPGFSGDGILVEDLGFFDEMLEAVAIDADGNIVAAGTVIGEEGAAILLIRVDDAGNLDGAFGDEGVVIDDINTTDVSEEILGLTLQGSNIVVAGTETNNGDVLLAGYEADGDRNMSFGVNGFVLTDNEGGIDSGYDVATTADNKLIVVGGTIGGTSDFFVVRYGADGLPDGTFGSGGLVSTDFDADQDTARAVAIQSDGKIVVAGSTFSEADNDDLGVARYLPEGTGADPEIDGFEGDEYTLTGTFDDPEVGTTHSIVIVWGDGTSTTLGPGDIGSGTFTVTHTFADDSMLVTAQIVETANFSNVVASDSAAATIENVAPEVDPIGGPAAAVRGQNVTFIGSFDDVGTLDTHEVSWDFGDGTTIDFHPSTDSGALTPSHAYANAGTYIVTLIVRDDDTGETTVIREQTIVIAQLEPAPCGCGTALVIGGTSSADVIVVSPATGGAVQVVVNSVNIGTFSPSHNVVVHAYDGNDDVNISSSVGLSAWLYGGAGDDRLKGGSGNDIILGQAGHDLLVGSYGRDILIGGTGRDRLLGDAHDDILIAGTTDHDANQVALCHLLAEWTSCRLYYLRLANLSGGCIAVFDRENGSFFLNDDTVHDDGEQDLLTGSSGMDWFFANLQTCGNDDSPTKDKISDKNWLEFATDIDFINS